MQGVQMRSTRTVVEIQNFRGFSMMLVVMMLLSLITQHHAFLAYFMVKSDSATTSQISQSQTTIEKNANYAVSHSFKPTITHLQGTFSHI
jgi:hypothetical protein